MNIINNQNVIKMQTIKIKNFQTNRIEFFQNGVKVFPSSVRGNIVSFKNGDIVLI